MKPIKFFNTEKDHFSEENIFERFFCLKNWSFSECKNFMGFMVI